MVSAASFLLAGVLPVLAMLAAPGGRPHPGHRRGRARCSSAPSVRPGARLGGAPMGRAAARVLVGSGVAMAVTALIGDVVGNIV